MKKTIKIGDKKIGDGQPLYFIADIAANHDGELDRALKLIELAKEAGADAAKFQNFKAKTIVSKKGFDNMPQLSHQSKWEKSVYEVYQDASISNDWTPILKAKCEAVGLDYFTSPYDFDAVDMVDKYVDVYKIGSGDISWIEILTYIAQKNKPMILATGASEMCDVERAINAILKYTNKIVLMQCNTNYTGLDENFDYINLNVLKSYAQKYPDIILGLSDHTHGCATIAGAVALGAKVFEKHFTDDNNRVGPDHTFSMNPKAWREMVTVANQVYRSLGDGIKRIEKNEKETAAIQRRGLRYAKDLPKGHQLKKEDIIAVRPYEKNSFHPYEIDFILNKKINKQVTADTAIKKTDLC